MFICFLILAIICLYKIKFSFVQNKKFANLNNYYSDYMSLEKTTSIKGIFTFTIIISHVVNILFLQLDSSSFLNSLYTLINGHVIGQSMVVAFLFYSGYGIMLSIKKKGNKYVNSIPANRMAKVVLHFDSAVLLYLVLQTLLGKKFSIYTILASLVGWENLGNADWYIFDIACLYFVTFIVFKVFGNAKNQYVPVAMTFLLTCCLGAVLWFVGKDEWWYDTIIIYPLGMLYCIVQDKVEAFFKKKPVFYWLILGVCCVLFVFSVRKTEYFFILEIKHILFMTVILLITMKVQIHNGILQFLGKHLFSIYILQQIPMIVLKQFGLTAYPVVFLVASVGITLLLCVPFDYLMERLDSVVFKNKDTNKNKVK